MQTADPSADMKVHLTQRLRLRPMATDDAAFIVELVTDRSWLRFIGNKGVRDHDDVRRYIEAGPLAMYRRLGFGLYVVELKDGGVPIGICGLIKRDTLDDVDLGFALLPRYRSQGYAFEAGEAMLAYGREDLRLDRVVAIVSPDNRASTRLLQKLGFAFERMIPSAAGAHEVALYATAGSATANAAGVLSSHPGNLP